MCFKWNIDKNILISAFLPKVCAVTGGRSGGMVIVAESGMDDVSAGMMVKEDGY